MSESTLNSLPVASLSVLLPRVGAWTADVTLDASTAPSGRATLVVGGTLTLVGTVVRGGLEAGLWRGRLVGGTGGLGRDVAAVAQQGTTLALALQDVLSAAGETLAATAGDLSALAPRWHRLAAPAAHAVADVARAAGYAWRTLPDGSVWLGAESWPAHAPEVDVVDWRPDLGRLELAGDVLGLLPGQTLTARADLTVRVGCVELRATGDALRAIVLVEPEPRERGRLLDAVARLVAALTRRLDYQALYPCRVVSQQPQGDLDLQPDDPRVPPCQGVPIRSGLPGVRVSVPAGARVLLTYEAGDPRRPVATLWEAETVTQLAVNGGALRAAREGHGVARSEALGTWISSVSTALGILPPTGAIGTIAEGADALRLP